jgi:hypothetical protein
MNQRWIKTVRFLLLMSCLTAAGNAAPPDETAKVVAHLGSTPIYQEELELHMRDQRAMVAVYFKAKHNANLTGAVWNQDFDGEVPAERLRRHALDACLRAKALQLLAIEHRVGKPLPFPNFHKHCRDINRRRREAREAGKILYGPVRYDPWQLYQYELSNLRIQLRAALSDELSDFDTSEAALNKAITARLAGAAVADD